MSQWTLSGTYCSHLPLHLSKQVPWHAISLYTMLHCSTSHPWCYRVPKQAQTSSWSERELQCDQGWALDPAQSLMMAHIWESICLNVLTKVLVSSPCGGWHHRIQEGNIHCQRSSSDSGCCSCCLRICRPHRRVLLRKRRFISISVGVITPPAVCEASPDAERTILGDFSHYQAAPLYSLN